MVHVQNAVHPFVDDIIHHFLHTRHPDGIDIRPRPGRQVPAFLLPFHDDVNLADMRIPGHRNTDRPETRFLEHVDQRPGGLGLPPGGLIILGGPRSPRFDPHVVDAAAVAVERVPEIPSGPHVDDRFRGRFKWRGAVIRFGLFVRDDGILPVPGIGIARTSCQQGQACEQGK